jgi:hypothetical protein
VTLTSKQIDQINKMNRSSQNPQLGTIIAFLQTNTSGSSSGSAVQANLTAHINKSGSDVHGLGTIAVQSASAVNITGGTITSLNTHTGLSGSNVHGLGTISTQSASAVNVTAGSITGIFWERTNISTVNSPYTISSSIGTLRCNAVGGSIVVLLIPAIGSGRKHNIKNLYTSTCVVEVRADITGTPDLIDGEATKTLMPKDDLEIQDGILNFWDIL